MPNILIKALDVTLIYTLTNIHIARCCRWGSGGGGPMGMTNRIGPQMGPGSMYPSNMDPGVPGMGMGIVPFGGGDRFDAYKQPYFKIVD